MSFVKMSPQIKKYVSCDYIMVAYIQLKRLNTSRNSKLKLTTVKFLFKLIKRCKNKRVLQYPNQGSNLMFVSYLIAYDMGDDGSSKIRLIWKFTTPTNRFHFKLRFFPLNSL